MIKNIQLGYCCINQTLRKKQIYCSRTMRLSTIKKNGIECLKRLILLNLEDLLKILKWNEANNIKCFRISSQLFPHFTNHRVEKYNIHFAKCLIKKIGDFILKYKHRVTFHPGQYNVLASPNEKYVKNTILDLEYHNKILDLFNCDYNSVIVIHGGGLYGDKKKTLERWKKNFNLLSVGLKKRLVIENCERNFSIEDCIDIHNSLSIPIVFDYHHHLCYKKLHPNEKFQDLSYYLDIIIKSWKNRKPKFHLSNQKKNSRIGAHSDYIDDFFPFFFDIYKKFNKKIDIFIEAKKTELALIDLYEKNISKLQ